MSSIDDNIRAAYQIIFKTHENINNLINTIENFSKQNNTDYKLLTEKFLRWRSDVVPQGFMIRYFNLIFQKENDKNDNIIYGVEISVEYSCIRVAKYVYNDKILSRLSLARNDEWYYSHPFWNKEIFSVTEEESGYKKSLPRSQNVKKKYLGLNYALFAEFPLSEIKADNVKEKVFGTFDKLAAVPFKN